MPGSAQDDLRNATPSAKDMAAVTKELFIALGADEEGAKKAAWASAKTVMDAHGIFGWVLSGIINLGSKPLLFFLEQITQMRTDCGDVFAEIAGAVLSEFLGTEIKMPSLKATQGSAANLAVSKAIGEALYTQLLTEFGPAQPLQPGDGERAAKIFSG